MKKWRKKFEKRINNRRMVVFFFLKSRTPEFLHVRIIMLVIINVPPTVTAICFGT